MSYKNPIIKQLSIFSSFKNPIKHDEAFIIAKNAIDEVNIGFESLKIQTMQKIDIKGSSQTEEIPLFKTQKNNITLEVSPDFVIFRNLKPYSNWGEFLKILIPLFDNTAFNVVYPIKSIKIETTDEFQVKQDCKIGKYLNCDGKIIPSFYEEEENSLDYDIGKGIENIDGYNQQIHLHVKKEIKHKNILLDLVAGHGNLNISNKEEYFSRLGQIKNEIFNLFETSVTDITKTEIMGGKNG